MSQSQPENKQGLFDRIAEALLLSTPEGCAEYFAQQQVKPDESDKPDESAAVK